MLLQGIVDNEMRFLDIVTGLPGGMTASRLLKFSGFYRLCEFGDRMNGNIRRLSEGADIRECIVGGVNHPLLQWFITPYEDDDDLSAAMLNFNKMHEAKIVTEKAFSQLKGSWRICNKVMWRPDKRKLPSIVLVCCLLHNIVIDCGDSLHPDVALSSHHDSGYSGQRCKQVDPLEKILRENLAKHSVQIVEERALFARLLLSSLHVLI